MKRWKACQDESVPSHGQRSSRLLSVWLWRPLQSPHKRVSGERAVFLSARLLPFKYSLHSCLSPASALSHHSQTQLIYLSVHLSVLNYDRKNFINLSVCLPAHLSIHPSITFWPSVHLPTCSFSTKTFIFSIFIYKASVHLFSIYPPIHSSIYLSVHSLILSISYIYLHLFCLLFAICIFNKNICIHILSLYISIHPSIHPPVCSSIHHSILNKITP